MPKRTPTSGANPLVPEQPDAPSSSTAHPSHAHPSFPGDGDTIPPERTSPARQRRGSRIDEAEDEATRLRLIQAARRRRAERIEKSARRQRERTARRLEQRRQALLQRYLPDDGAADWELPRVRRLLDEVLTDARERRLFLLPPKTDVQVGGIRRIVGRPLLRPQ